MSNEDTAFGANWCSEEMDHCTIHLGNTDQIYMNHNILILSENRSST